MDMTDICLCANYECDKYHDCWRGGKGSGNRRGIYTIGLLKSECNKDDKYLLFIGDEDNGTV